MYFEISVYFKSGERKFAWNVCIMFFIRENAKMIFSRIKNIVFFPVFRYYFSPWPKTLHNSDIYRIIFFH